MCCCVCVHMNVCMHAHYIFTHTQTYSILQGFRVCLLGYHHCYGIKYSNALFHIL